MNLKEPSDEERAYHEAGHALIAHASSAFRLKVGGHVSIANSDEEFGGTDVELVPDAEVSNFRRAYENGVVTAAGWSAQRRHLLETHQEVDESLLQLGAAADLKDLTEIFGSGVFYEFATIADKRFDEGSNWIAVQRLANELLTLRKLTAADAEAILDL